MGRDATRGEEGLEDFGVGVVELYRDGLDKGDYFFGNFSVGFTKEGFDGGWGFGGGFH